MITLSNALLSDSSPCTPLHALKTLKSASGGLSQVSTLSTTLFFLSSNAQSRPHSGPARVPALATSLAPLGPCTRPQALAALLSPVQLRHPVAFPPPPLRSHEPPLANSDLAIGRL
ncbi:hypothetical protein GOP47_0014145, partial [Adiantum capillus-veneris]